MNRIRGPGGSRRGIALLFSLAILAVLVALATTLVRIGSIDRDLGRMSVSGLQAELASASGIEHAIAVLRTNATRRSYDSADEAWRYGGEDFDGDGALSGRHEDTVANLDLDLGSCPVESALSPSLAIRQANGHPRLEAGVGISGWLGVPGSRNRSVYSLKVIDCAAQIDANGDLGDPDGATRIGRMIDRLWEAIVERNRSAPALSDVGEHILAARPEAGFASEAEIEAALVSIEPDEPAVGREVFRLLAPHLTCHAWRDHTVLVPRGAERSAEASGDAVEVDRILRFDSLERTSRAPVNVNTADPAVLYACLAGLSGWVFLEGSLYHHDPETGLLDYSSPRPGTLRQPDRYVEVRIEPALASDLAESLVRFRRERGAIRNWDEFDTWLDREAEVGPLTPWQKDLIRAQASPDSLLNKFNPAATRYGAVDKSDLIEATTEFCFSSMGYFEIESYGRVLSPEDEVLSAALTRTVVRVYDVLRDTTAADFAAGIVETSLPGGAPALEIGPEIPGAPDTGYDGTISLATIRPVLAHRPSLHATFSRHDPSWWRELLVSEGETIPRPGPLVGTNAQGLAFEDGLYSQSGSTPVLPLGSGLLGQDSGALAFWYKPNYQIVGGAPRPHCILNLNGVDPESTCQLYTDTQLSSNPDRGPRHLLKFLAWDVGNDRPIDLEIDLTRITRPREWILITLRWSPERILLKVRSPEPDEPNEVPTEYEFIEDLQLVRVDNAVKAYYDEEITRWSLLADWSNVFVTGIYDAQMRSTVEVGRYWFFLQNSASPLSPALSSAWYLPPPVPVPEVVRREGGFLSEEEAIAWMDQTVERTRDGTYGLFMNVDGRIGAFERRGESPFAGTSGYFPSKPVQFRFASDPTAALRLGGFLKLRDPDHPDSFQLVEASSDGTYGDLFLFDQLPEDLAAFDADLSTLVDQGRYYGAGDASFLSRELDVEPGHRLGTISWRSHGSAADASGSIVLEMLDRQFTTPGDCPIDSIAGDGPLRYRARFPGLSQGVPLLETPLLDSVTVTTLGPTRFLSWSTTR